MTSEIRARIKGKPLIMKVGGFEGSEETDDPIKDIQNAKVGWVKEADVKRLKIRSDQNIIITIAGRKIRGKVKNYSRGSKQIIFKNFPKLKRKQIERLRAI